MTERTVVSAWPRVPAGWFAKYCIGSSTQQVDIHHLRRKVLEDSSVTLLREKLPQNVILSYLVSAQSAGE